MVERPSVSPSVRLSHRLTAAAVVSGLAAERPVGRRYRSSAAGAAYQLQSRQQQRRRSMAVISKCGQCHVDS